MGFATRSYESLRAYEAGVPFYPSCINVKLILHRYLLADAEQALKNKLLVQIYSTGIRPNKLSLFKTKFDPNQLGYDAILEMVNDDGTLISDADITLSEAKDIQRIMSHFYITDTEGKFTLNSSKLNKDIYQNFFLKVVDRALDYNLFKDIQLDNGQIKYILKSSSKDFISNVIIGEIKQLFVESFGSLLGFSDADKEFISQLSSVAFKNNIYDAVSVMHRGLHGEDTSVLADPLLEAMKNSTLGDPVIAAKKFNDFFGVQGTVSSVICYIPVLNLGREEVCTFSENKGGNPVEPDSEYTIDFNELKVIDTNQNPSGFRVVALSPRTGVEATEFEMNMQRIIVEFNQEIFQGAFADLFDLLSAEVKVFNMTTNEPLICDELTLLEDNTTLKCLFNDNQLQSNSEYAFSVAVQSADKSESISVISSFSTPAYLVDSIVVSQASGKYYGGLEVEITIPDGFEIYYTLNDRNLSKNHATLYSAGELIQVNRTSALRVVAYMDNVQVSPVTRRVYQVVCERDEKEVNGQCVPKTCEEDGYSCPVDNTVWSGQCYSESYFNAASMQQMTKSNGYSSCVSCIANAQENEIRYPDFSRTVCHLDTTTGQNHYFIVRNQFYFDFPSYYFAKNIYSQKLTCSTGQKEVDGQCIAKTCQADSYDCPVCQDNETLKYASDRGGYCEAIVSNIPGSSCGAGKVFDCNLKCVDNATVQSWIGDGYCDDGGSEITLNCLAFNNDSGDCDTQPVVCLNSEKVVSGQCVPKTCQADSYGCPVCGSNEILKYFSDGTGYCEIINPLTKYTKIDANGYQLPESASDWSCVKDNETGLIWEVKVNDSSLRQAGRLYTWYSNIYDYNSDYNSGCGLMKCDTKDFVQQVNVEGLCGAHDWHLPSLEALKSLVDTSFSPTINTNYFPHTLFAYYWSATPSDNSTEGAWAVGFRFGDSGNGQRNSGTLNIRLVR